MNEIWESRLQCQTDKVASTAHTYVSQNPPRISIPEFSTCQYPRILHVSVCQNALCVSIPESFVRLYPVMVFYSAIDSEISILVIYP